tara:strand:+ start:732 stop:1169 length:438 start_codon:yes stop_codon:yes gene_type:complete
MTTVAKGHNVKVHYKGTLTDGTEFDNSRSRGETLDFQVGSGQLIKGFDTAVRGMGIGEVKTVTLKPTEAYGETDPAAIVEYPKSVFAPGTQLVVGHTVQGTGPTGQPVMAKITSLDEETVTLDHNHPLAGQDLTFEIELIESDSE